MDCYITGTDTGIGKTHVSAALLRSWRSRGAKVLGMKPVASGCEPTVEGLRSDDALQLIAAADGGVPYAWTNPYALRDPLAPELAAENDGVVIALETIRLAFADLRTASDEILVEGVGGWLSPISASIDQKDIALALRLPVIMVVGMRLGCVHQARATARGIEADECDWLGWVANEIDPAMEAFEENVAILERVLARPPLAVLRFEAEAKNSGLPAKNRLQ